mgnify:FL=1|jgi:hypothetical protein
MNKETINDLLTLTEKQSSKQNLTINKNNVIYNVSINADKGKVHIDIEKKKLSNKEVFEKWLTENVDDDIFTEAYAKLSEYSGLSLHDLDEVYKNYTDEFIKDFKEIIKQVATDKINDILLKYELK